MELLTNKYRAFNVRRKSAARMLGVVAFVGLLLVVVGFAGAPASKTGSGWAVPVAQGQTNDLTPTANTESAPSPVSTAGGGAPQAVGTGAPNAVGTNSAAPVEPATGTTSAPGGDFPWLIVLGLAVLVLAGLGYAAMRQRGAAEPVEAQATQATNLRRKSDITKLMETTSSGATGEAGTQTGTETEATTAPATELAGTTAAAAATTVPAPAAVSQPAAMPDTLQCPNCGTANSTSEKFCHECGQDLRPELAKLAAAAAAATAAPPPAPVDVVEANTPYLETLDRVDDQLEFVLSRPRVVIGTAAGNDIVIDAAFKGWKTVAPVHAELRREQEGFAIVDRDSENGTFVNEIRTGENILADGDLVRLGDVRFIFRIPK